MRRGCLLGVLLLVLCISGRDVGARQSGSDPILDAWGFEENRGYLSELPFEHIDTLTGNVLLTFTDLELPGNGGLDVRIVRTFNSKPPAGWNFGLAGYPFRILNPDGPPPGTPDPRTMFPRLLMTDGARYEVFAEAQGNYTIFRSKQFWRYHVSGRRLQLTNGTECFYNASGNLIRVQDAFGNRIELEYGSTQKLDRIRQILGFGIERLITFQWFNVGNVPSSMSYLGRTWSYEVQTIQSGQTGRVSRVTPPAGGQWFFEYQFEFPELLQRLTTPNNGVIEYDFQMRPVWNGSSAPSTRVLTDRWTTPGGTSLSGTWTFQYPAFAGDRTTVTGPHGVMADYAHGAPVGTTERVLQTTRRFGNFVPLETESRQYQTRAVTSWGDGIIVLPTVRTISRDNTTYTTTLSYHSTDFADYGRPWQVVEQGQRQRTTTFTFDYGFDASRWIKDKVSQETTTVDNESFTISRSHNFQTGFVESETRYGITTLFTSDGRGNVASETDPHNHVTSYSYAWGVVENTTTPLYQILRGINQDGTVASELRRSHLTTFEYDAIGRRRFLRPPIGAPIETQYFANEVRELRGGVSRRSSYLDGFGRVRRTDNTVGVITTTRYDALGRKIFESLPFEGTAEVGTTYRYDGLSRLREVEHTGTTPTTYAYGTGGDVTISEPNGTQGVRTTLHDYSAFGDPSEPQLVGVTDAEGSVWRYRYNALGRLTGVTQPGEFQPSRTWTYVAGHDLLQSETHPESGTTTYTYSGGRLATKMTQRTTFTYGYDFNDRLTSVIVPGIPSSPHSVTIAYDESDNRTQVRNQYVNSTFRYDGANRLEWRKDDIQGQPDLMQTFYMYDDLDNVTRIQYPSLENAFYTYDTEGRPRTVSAATVPIAEALAYHPSGAISRLRLGNGIIEDYTFHPQRHWLTSISGGPVRLNYSYQPVGNIERIDNLNSSAFNQQFSYDRLDRVLQVTGFGAAFHQYDALGNRTFKDALQYLYNGATRRLTQVVGPTPHPEVGNYLYDPDGATQIDPIGNYTYTPFGMLDTARVGANTTLYLYDGDNVRKVKLGAVAEFYIHGSNGELLSEYRGPHGGIPAPSRDYVYLGSRLVASLTPFQAMVGFVSTSTLVNEGAGSLTLTVRLTTTDGQPLAQTVNVPFATVNGTAVAGQDYTHTTGTLQFAAGTANNATRTITVPILDDSVFEEADEAFTISLSPPQNARLSLGSHTVNIRDNEPWVTGYIDMPANASTIRGAFQLGGWAVDRRAVSGTGIDAVHLYARPGPNFAAPGVFLGPATHNDRPDVAAWLGQQFLHSGYGLLAQGLPANDYDIVAYVHIVSTGQWTTLPVNRVTAVTGQVMSLETPTASQVVNQAFTVSGWAIDQDATSGTGVDQVTVTAQPLPGGAPIPLGAASYGLARQDVANAYGSRFVNSGFSLTSTTLPAGSYRLDVSARSTVPGANAQVRSVTITVRTDPRMSLDAPAHGSTTGQPFMIGGWAVDLAAASGTGISTVHIWAFPVAGGNPVFLGVPAFGPRPDVANIFGAQFLNSGFTLPSVAGLPPGQWQIGVYAMSTLTGTFNQSAAATITLPVPNGLIAIDAPAENATVGQPFGITGWAIDLNSPNTVGIAALHIYAYPWSGAPPIFIGAPAVWGPRPDVAAYYGAHYVNSGWGITASGLPAGTYTIVAHPISTGNQVVANPSTRVVHVQ